MSTELQTLVRAREMVVDGWVKGSAYADGRRRCAGQAITDAYREITGATPVGAPCLCGSCRTSGAWDDFHRAIEAFTIIIDTPSIPSWNDAPARTHGEVIHAFDRAIERLQNREAQVQVAVVPEKIEATWKPVTIPGPEPKVIPVMIKQDEPVGVVKKVLASIGV